MKLVSQGGRAVTDVEGQAGGIKSKQNENKNARNTMWTTTGT